MDIVLDFNPGLENANLIRVNQKIRLPRMTEELLILENPDQTYQIHAGTYADPDASRRYSNVVSLERERNRSHSTEGLTRRHLVPGSDREI